MSQPYTREQIYDAMRQADAAGDAEAVKALAAALQSGATADEMNAMAADKGLQLNQGDLQANIASRDAGGQTNAVLPPERNVAADLGVTTAKAASKAVMGPYDLLNDASAGVQNALTYAITDVPAYALDAMGADEMAQTFRTAGQMRRDSIGEARNALSFRDNLDQTVATPQGYETSEFVSELGTGMMIPFGPKGKLPVRAPQPAAKPKQTKAIPDAEKVVAAGNEHGVRVMTSDVRPPRGFTGKISQAVGERIPIAGTGGPRVKQNEERIEAVKRIALEYVGEAGEAIDDVAADLAATRGGRIQALTKRKDKVIDDLSGSKPDQEPNPSNSATSGVDAAPKSKPDQNPLPELRHGDAGWAVVDRSTGKAVTEIMKPDAAQASRVNQGNFELIPTREYLSRVNALIKEAGGVQPSDDAFKAAFGSKASPSAPKPAASPPPTPPAGPTAVNTPRALAEIDRQIARLGSMNNDAVEPVIKKLEAFKRTLTSGLSLRGVEDNRRILGEMFEDPSLASIKSVGQKAINAIYAPLRDDMGDFIKQTGGDEAFKAWKSANDELAAMAGELKVGAFKRVLNDAETTPENAAKLLFSKKPSEVRRLFANLSDDGKVKARAAVIQHAIEKAGGINDVSPKKFANALDSFGKTTGIIFGDEAQRIEGLAILLQKTQRASEAAAAPPTGVQSQQFIGGSALTALFGPFAAAGVAGTAGLAARLYESAAVRNLLVPLSKAKPGSVQERKILDRIAKAITPIANNWQDEIARAANDNASRGALVAEERVENQ